MNWLTGSLLAVALLALILVGFTYYGEHRWTRETGKVIARLDAGRQTSFSPGRYDPGEIAGLPAPVQRYFRAVLKPGQAIVTAVTIEHTGTFNLSATGEQWRPFTSRQRVITRRPGFLWNARIQMAPGIAVLVHDSYIGGQGLLHATVQGLVDVANTQAGGELARGELMRFLAEAAWYPTALLPSQGVQWSAVDDRSANATLDVDSIALTLLFRFDEAGLMQSVRAEARGRMSGSEISMAPWEGRWSNQQQVEGMTVPFTGEVDWVLPEGRKTYWRGTISTLDYEWAP